ncbi:methyl-accepting chemotaxis protein, partial [Neomoorella humiferrea]
EIAQSRKALSGSLVTISIIVLLILAVITYFFTRTITTPLILAVDLLGLIASGDFTRTVPDNFLRMKDEIGKVAQAVDRLQANLRPLLSGLRDDAKTLASNSENLSASSEEIASSSGEVAKAIQQVAAGASDQSSHLQEILGLVENITASLEKVYTELSHVKTNSEETSRLASIGKKELDVLIASIKGVHEAFKVVAEKLTSLSGSVNQIGEILEVINGIAEQTNLLALNAAIEAARAGEAGRGFAVVAEEVRKLAEQSSASSDKIRVLLNTIGSETNEVVHTSEEVSKQVVAQLENVENTVKAFDNILEAVAAIAPMIEATYREVDSTVKAKDVLLDRVQSVSAVSEEASASAEEISASAEELSASTQEIAANAQQVLEVAKRLEEQVGRFKV